MRAPSPYVCIPHLEVEPSLKFLWIMYVERVDPRHHCLRCLRGKRSARVDNAQRSYRDLVLDESQIPTLYLCGVTPGAPLAGNAHLAFRAREGAHFTVDSPQLKARVEGAERLAIDPWQPPTDLGERHTRCRNWQFAKAFESHQGRPPLWKGGEAQQKT